MFGFLKRALLPRQKKALAVRKGTAIRFRPLLELLEDRLTPTPGFNPIDNDGSSNLIDENAANNSSVDITALSPNPPTTPVSYALTDSAGGRFQIDSNSGVVTVANGSIIDYEGSGGSYVIKIQASAGGNFSDEVPFTINVNNLVPADPTDANTVKNVIAENAGTGAIVGITASSTDPAGGTVTFSLSDDAGGAFTIDANSGVVSIADGSLINYESSGGSYSITVVATDGGLSSNGISFTIYLLQDLGVQYNGEGDSVNLGLTGGSGSLTFSASGLPSGLSINSSTGVISGTIASGSASDTPYLVTINVTNGPAGVSTTLQWVVTSVVALDAIDDQLNVVGDSVSVQASADNTDYGTLSFSATGLPSGLTIDTDTGEITGTIDSGAESGSPYSVTVTATVGSKTANQSFSWFVTLLGLTPPGDQVNVSGDNVSLTINASNATGSGVAFSATGLPASLSINSSTGEISGTLTSSDESGTPYTVTVTATAGTESDNTIFLWSVGAIALDSIDDQQAFTGQANISLTPVLRYNGINTPSFSSSGLPDGLTINTSTGEISGTIDDDADDASPYNVTITVTAGAATANQSLSWCILPAVLIGTLLDQTNAEGQSVSLAVPAIDAFSNTITYGATGLPSGLSIDTDTGVISGTLASGAASGTPYSITVTATAGGRSDSATFSWNVAATGPAINDEPLPPADMQTMPLFHWERTIGRHRWTLDVTNGRVQVAYYRDGNLRRSFSFSAENSSRIIANIRDNPRDPSRWFDGVTWQFWFGFYW